MKCFYDTISPIIKYIYDNRESHVYSSLIARELNLNQKTVSTYLNILTKSNELATRLLVCKKEGNMKFYSISEQWLSGVYKEDLQIIINKTK